MKMLIYAVVTVIGVCEACSGMLAEKPSLFRGFNITRIDDNTVNVSLNQLTLRVTPDLFGMICFHKTSVLEENSVIQQIKQKGKLTDLKEGMLEFFRNEEEESMETEVRSFWSVDEIMHEIESAKTLMCSNSRTSIFEGAAVDDIRSTFSALKEHVQKSIDSYDKDARKQLLEVIRADIGVLYKTTVYAYDELPDYSRKQVDNYVSYYTIAMDKLKEIAECLERGE